jgi:hypothetical protein
MKPSAFLTVAFISIFVIFASLPVNSQQYAWSDPLAASDSLADNRNAIIIELPFNGVTDYYIFWERSADSSSTAIYYKKFYSSDDPVQLLGSENIHYRNPQFMLTHSPDEDTLFYFFFESDENGNSDIFYQVYTVNGFEAPVILEGSLADETHFHCNGTGSMVWQEGDKIKYGIIHNWNHPYSISDPVTIDSINCSEPDIPPDDNYWTTSSYICWLKTVDDISSVYYTYYAGNITDPILLSDSGNNISAHFAMSSCMASGDMGYVISWESVIAGQHTIEARNLWQGDYTGNFSQPAPYSPAISLYAVPVDELNANGFMTFIYDDSQNSDILVSEDGFWIPDDLQYFINISDSPNQETHPAFFNGRFTMPYFTDLILIWESMRNEHWQLFYSINTLACGGSINETDNPSGPELTVSPNPARNECDINYTIDKEGPVSLRLCTLDGRQVILFDRSQVQKGTYSYHLDFDKVFPGRHYSGIFLIRLQAGQNSIAQKVISL